MQARVQKWGNSLGIRIPRSLAQVVGLSECMPVEFKVENGSVVIRPKRYSLEELLSRATLQNLHEEVGTGSSVGREAW